ncbi:hypothetical protein ACMFMF_007025 [Clarireedia jacksonii]
MSSRQLRKLRQQRELEEQSKLRAQEEEEEESDDDPLPVQSKPSLFANLATLKNENDEDDAKDSDHEEQPDDEGLNEPTPPPAPTANKPKKSKKKKKAKNKTKDIKKDPEDTSQNGLDEIDEALKELNLKRSTGANANDTVQKDEGFERVCTLLGINTQHLKVANEMRSLFGSAAIGNHDDDEAGAGGRGHRRRQRMQQMDLETVLKGHHKPGKGLSELTLRRNFFIQGKEEWPKSSSGGLSMAVLDDQTAIDGTVEYKYVHDQTYQALQQSFYAYVEMGNPENLVGLLARNPYHISLLLQVSKIAKDQGDHSLSSDLVERALFTFGRVALSSFSTKLSQGKARLDFARPENRELWLAGYHYIKSLIMKGTYRTAFEWSKLLLSLDPEEDPYCMRWMIHHLALRAHAFHWLLDFADTHVVEAWDSTIQYAVPSFVLAALQLKDGARSRSLLQQSMEQVPWLFCRLFKELGLETPPSIWGKEPRTEAETLFTELYVLQAHDLWNTPEATSLLMEIAHILDKIDVSTLPILSNEVMTLDVVRFIYLDNRPALMALAPSHLLHRSNNSDADPLPPDTNVISYASQQIHLERSEGGAVDGYDDPIAALARLIPNFPGLEALRNGWNNGNNNEAAVDSDEDFNRLRDDLTNAIQTEETTEGEAGAERPVRAPISLANATEILNRLMFWRAPAYADPSDSGTDTEAEETNSRPASEGEHGEARANEDDDDIPSVH